MRRGWRARFTACRRRRRTAPYAWAALAGTHDEQLHLWHADPVHIAIGRDSLIVQDLGNAMPSEAEADALISAASEALRPAGCALQRQGLGGSCALIARGRWAPRPLSAVLGQPMPVTGRTTAMRCIGAACSTTYRCAGTRTPSTGTVKPRACPSSIRCGCMAVETWRSRTPLRWPRVHTQRVDLQGLAIAAALRSPGRTTS